MLFPHYFVRLKLIKNKMFISNVFDSVIPVYSRIVTSELSFTDSKGCRWLQMAASVSIIRQFGLFEQVSIRCYPDCHTIGIHNFVMNIVYSVPRHRINYVHHRITQKNSIYY